MTYDIYTTTIRGGVVNECAACNLCIVSLNVNTSTSGICTVIMEVWIYNFTVIPYEEDCTILTFMVIKLWIDNGSIHTYNVDCSTTSIVSNIAIEYTVNDSSAVSVYEYSTCISSCIECSSIVFQCSIAIIGWWNIWSWMVCSSVIVCKITSFDSYIICYGVPTGKCFMLPCQSTNHNCGTLSTFQVSEFAVTNDNATVT